MKRIKHLQRGRFVMSKRRSNARAIASVLAATLFSTGCAEKRPRAYPWATAIHVRPHVPLPAPGYNPPPIEESAPDLPWEFLPSAANLVVARQPAKPRVAA